MRRAFRRILRPFAPPKGNARAPTFRGQNVFNLRTPRSGIAYSLVLEWAQAARWWYVPWDQWEQIPVEQQEFMIAAYRTHVQIESVLAHYPDKLRRKPRARPRPR